MKAAVYAGRGRLQQVEDVAIPVPAAYEVLVKVALCGICASDLKTSAPADAGKPEPFRPGLDVLGHEFCGSVVEVGPSAQGFRPGDRLAPMAVTGCGSCVSCRVGEVTWCARKRPITGGYGQFAVVSDFAAIRIPEALTDTEAALVEPLAAGRHAIRLAGIRPGARVLVLGAGVVGLACVLFARRAGASRTVVATRTPRRAKQISLVGADAWLCAGESLANTAAEALGGAPDVVVEATGAPGLLATAIACVRPRGRIVVPGACFDTDEITPLDALIKEVIIQFSLSYDMRDFADTVDTLACGAIRAGDLVTRTVTLADFPATFEQLRACPDECKVMVDPWLSAEACRTKQ